jgi:hypothetical protein
MPNQKRESNKPRYSPQAKFMLLPLRRIISLDLAETEQEADSLQGKIIALSNEALPVYNAVAEAFINQYQKNTKHDYGSTHEDKVRGIIGNDAIHATLNECGIFYKTDQLFASFVSDRIWHDFILAPSGVKIEIKTSDSKAKYLNINKKHWQDSQKPDVVISLRLEITRSLILIEFAGWCYASDVDNFEFKENKINQNKSYFRCEIKNLHRPVNLTEFLTGLAANGGMSLREKRLK